MNKGPTGRVCPEAFVHGDREHTGALTQISKWIPRKGGDSSLKWDDHADAWAFAMDSKLQEFSPKPAHDVAAGDPSFDPFDTDNEPDYRRSRYCGII